MEDWKAFDQAAGCLPGALRLGALALPEQVRSRCEELHLRAGRQMTWSDPAGEQPVMLRGNPLTVGEEELRLVVELATRSSLHAALEGLRQGYVTLSGGHRLGLCGQVATEGGQIRGFRHLSSADLRIARQRQGIGAHLLSQLQKNGALASTLILSPPGFGKTTLLRELVRTLSTGAGALRVGLMDQRGEVAALCQGVPQLDVGHCTDVLEGCPKGVGLMLLLRGMNPQVLAVDEITAPEDVEALMQAAGCGVTLLATAHGWSREDLLRRPLYRTLWQEKLFSHLLLIRMEGGQRQYQVERLL